MNATTFQKGGPGNLEFPLTEIPKHTNLVNPLCGKSHDLPEPARPGSEAFQEALGEVVKVRKDVEAGVWPTWFFEAQGIDPAVPKGLEFLALDSKGKPDPQKAAEAVRMDFPAELLNAMLRFLASEGVQLNFPTQEGNVDFLSMVQIVEEESCAFRMDVGRKCFEAKSYFGGIRPEEALNLEGKDFTAYEEGCPNHGEYPTGHGTFAGANAAFVLKHLPTKQPIPEAARRGVLLMAAHFAHWRTLAGVHFGFSNNISLSLGYGEEFPWAEIEPK